MPKTNTKIPLRLRAPIRKALTDPRIRLALAAAFLVLTAVTVFAGDQIAQKAGFSPGTPGGPAYPMPDESASPYPKPGKLSKDLKIYITGGDYAENLPFVTNPIQKDDGTPAKDTPVDFVLKRPDGRQVTFTLSTNSEGRVIGIVAGTELGSNGQYQLTARLSQGAILEGNTTFAITETKSTDDGGAREVTVIQGGEGPAGAAGVAGAPGATGPAGTDGTDSACVEGCVSLQSGGGSPQPGSINVSGSVTAGSGLKGSGADVTDLNAANVSTGTLSNARLDPLVSLLGQTIGAPEVEDAAIVTSKLSDAAVTLQKVAADAIDASKVIDGSIATAELADNATTLQKLADDAVNAQKIIDGSVGTVELSDLGVTTGKLADVSVTLSKLADGSVDTAKIVDGAVAGIDIADLAVGTAKLEDAAVSLQKLAANSVDSSKIADGTVASGDLGDLQVTTQKLNDVAVTLAKLAPDSVDASKIVDGSVATADVADSAVTGIKIANGAISNVKLDANAVTSDKIADGAIATADLGDLQVATAKLADSAVTLQKLSNDSVDAQKVIDGSIGTGELANLAVTLQKLAADSVDSSKIADGTVSTGDIGDLQVSTQKLADAAVSLSKLADNSVNSAKVADGAISTADLGDLQVTTSKINDAAITLSKLSANSVDASKIVDLSVTTAKLTDASVTLAKLAPNSVDSSKIADGSVSTGDLGDAQVTNAKLAGGITDDKLNTITSAGKVADSALSANIAKLDAAQTFIGAIIFKNAANGADAFRIQRADGTDLVNVNTQTGTVSVTGLAADGSQLTNINAGNITSGTLNNARLDPVVSLLGQTIGTGELEDAAITAQKLAANSVDSSKIADGSIATADLGDLQVATGKLADAAVTLQKLSANSVDASKVVDGSIGTGELADLAVTLQKLAAGSVDSSKIVDGAVSTADIGDLQVSTAKLADAAVSLAKLADNSVNSAKVVDGSISTADIGDLQVTTSKINDAAITLSKLGANSVDTSKIVDLSVTTAKLNDASVTLAKLAPNSVDSSKIVDGSVSTGDVGDAQITNGKLAGGITDDKLNTISTAGKVADSALSANIAKLNAAQTFIGATVFQNTVDGANAFRIRKADGTDLMNINTSTGTVTISGLAADGSQVTNINAGNITAGTLNNARLDPLVSLLGQTIGTGELENAAVTLQKLAADSVDSSKIADGSVATADLGDLQVTGAKIANGTVTLQKLADNSVNTAKIVDGSVSTADIGDGQVSNAKLAGGITDDKLNTITSAGKVADSALSANIARLNANQTFTGAVIYRNAVNGVNAFLIERADGSDLVNVNTQTGTVTIAGLSADGANVTNINAGNITTGTLNNARLDPLVSLLGQTIGTGELEDAAVTLQKLAADSVNSSKIVDASIGTADLGDGQVTLAKLAANSVDSGKIVDGSVANADLGANAVTTDKIADGTISTGDLGDGQVTNAKLAGGITDDKLNTISAAGKVADSALSSNVALKNINNNFSVAQTFQGNVTVNGGFSNVGSNASTYLAGIHNTSTNANAKGLSIRVDQNSATNMLIAAGGTSLNTFTVSGTGAVNTIGSYQTGGVTRLDASGNLTNIGTISSGLINGQTISSAANFTGTVNAATGYSVGGTAGVSGSACAAGQALTGFTFTSGLLTGATSCAPVNGDTSITLQDAYDQGNTITTADNKDVKVTLANTATDSSFVVDVATGSTGGFKVQRGGVDKLTVSGDGDVVGTSFSGSGAGLTSLNASNITSGTLADARLSANVSLLGQSIGTAELEDNAVTSVKIADGTIATADLGNAQVTNAKIATDAVALGSQTTGSYVSNLGTLTGLTTTGNTGEASTPTLAVNYGSAANTAVQGNTVLTCPSGTGNLTGGGTALTLGAGGTCAALDTVNNPTFSTSVTTPVVQSANATALTLQASGGNGGGNVVVNSAPSSAAVGLVVQQGGTQSGRIFLQGTGNASSNAIYAPSQDNIHFTTGATPGAASGTSRVMFELANDRINLGSGGDTNLYRAATGNELKTDDAFSAASFKVGATAGVSGSACAAGQALTGFTFTSGILTGSPTCSAFGQGTITGVTAGTNLSGGGTSGNVTLNVVPNPTFTGNVTIGHSAQNTNRQLNVSSPNASTDAAIGFAPAASSVGGYVGRFQVGGDEVNGNNYYTYLANGARHNDGSATVDSYVVNNQYVDGQILTMNANNGFRYLSADATADGQTVTATERFKVDNTGKVTTQGRILTGGTGTGGVWLNGTANSQFIGSIDANTLGIWNGSAWKYQFNNTGQLNLTDAGSSAGLVINDTNLYRAGADILKTDDQLAAAGTGTGIGYKYNPATATGSALYNQIGSDANPQFAIRYDGQMQWGVGGATPTDVTLYRGGADTLTTNDTFYSLRSATSNNAYTTAVSGDTVYRWVANADGRQEWGSGTAARDTNLYRDAADRLRTDDTFYAPNMWVGASDVVLSRPSPNTLLVSGNATAGFDVISRAGAGNESLLGSAGPSGQAGIKLLADTNLYRSAADTLKTDDTFDAAAYKVGGAAGASGAACGAGTALTGAAFTGGILTTAGSCTPVGTGDITGVTAGAGLTGGGTSGDVTVDLGTLTGLTAGADTLAVNYGSAANTAVQGNTVLTCPSGTGNLTGGGTALTLGAGGTCAALNTVASPSFTNLTVTGNTAVTDAFANDYSQDFTQSQEFPYVDQGDELRFRTPSGVERWNGTAWETWAGAPNFGPAHDGRGDTETQVPNTTSQFRLTYAFDGCLNPYALIQQDYQPDTFNFTAERWDGAAWVSMRTQNGLNGYQNVVYLGADNCNFQLRFTFNVTSFADTVFRLVNFQLKSSRPASQGGLAETLLPIGWDYNKAVTVKPVTNTANALNVQNSSSASVFNVNTSTGQVAIPTTGSGAGLTIGGDTNLYRSAADTLKTDDNLEVAGTSTHTGQINLNGDVYGNGKLAIRTSDAWLRLNNSSQFTSGVYTPGVLRVDGELQQGANDFGAYGIQSSSAIYSNNNIIANGNIGVGTTNPVGKLEVSGGSSATTTPQLVLSGGASGTISDTYTLDSLNTNTGLGWAAKATGINVNNQVNASNQLTQRTVNGGITGAAAYYLGADDVNQGAFGVLSTPQGSIAGAVLQERFTVRGDGKVGIGNSSPGYLLDVAGDVNATGAYRQNGTAGSTASCSGGQVLQNQVVSGGITTGGTCAAPSGGTITGVTAGTNLSGGGTSGNVTLNVVASPSFTNVTASGNLNLAGTINNAGKTFLQGIPSNGDIYANIRVLRSMADNADGMYINYGGTGGSAKIYDGGTTNYLSVNPGGNLALTGNTVIDASGGWHRTYGSTGWYNETYGGGWYMTDTSTVRAYNDKNVSTAGTVSAGQFTTASNGLAAINLTATTGTPGITFGGDTNLYRSAANTLKTDDNLEVAGTVTASTGLTSSGPVNGSELQVGGTTRIDSSGNLTNLGGNVRSDNAFQFLTSGGSAQQGRFGSLLTSNNYADASSVPANGIYSRGNVVTGGSYTSAGNAVFQGSELNLGTATAGLGTWRMVHDSVGDRLYMGFSGTAGGTIQLYANGTSTTQTHTFGPGGNASFTGTLNLGTLGSSNTNNQLCRNTSNVVSPCTGSSKAYKEDIKKLSEQDYENALDKIVKSGSYTYRYKEGEFVNRNERLGIIAENLPEGYTYKDEKGNPVPDRFATADLMWAGIIALSAKVDVAKEDYSKVKVEVDKLTDESKLLATKVEDLSKKVDEASKKAAEAASKATVDQLRQEAIAADKQQTDELNKRISELENQAKQATPQPSQPAAQPTAPAGPPATPAPSSPAPAAEVQDSISRAQIQDLVNKVNRLEQSRLAQGGANADQQRRVVQGSAGPYPVPEVAIPAANQAAASGIGAQIQGAATGISLTGSDGRFVSNSKDATAFELKTAEDKQDGRLLVIKNKDAEKFVIDKDGRIITQSVTTASLTDRAVTSAKLNPGKVDYRLTPGDDFSTPAADFTDIDAGAEYQSGPTDESLVLNGRLMAKNVGGQGVGARIVVVIGGQEQACNESFEYNDNWSTLSVPCTVAIPANTRVTIKWQVQAGEGGTAVVFRKTNSVTPYINGFATAK